jgi:hypothetical protein
MKNLTLNDIVTAVTLLASAALGVLRYLSARSDKAKAALSDIRHALGHVAGVVCAVGKAGDELGLDGAARKAEFEKIFTAATGVDPATPEIDAARKQIVAGLKNIYASVQNEA